MAAARTVLQGIGRIHRNELTTGPCCLVRQKVREVVHAASAMDFARQWLWSMRACDSRRGLRRRSGHGNLPEGDLPFDDSMLSSLPEARRIVLRALRQRVRRANFQRNVLIVYERQCAMCRTQLDLIEAAHVIPVAHPQSVDVVPNGIALCVLHHRAFSGQLYSDIGDAKLEERNHSFAVNRSSSSIGATKPKS